MKLQGRYFNGSRPPENPDALIFSVVIFFVFILGSIVNINRQLPSEVEYNEANSLIGRIEKLAQFGPKNSAFFEASRGIVRINIYGYNEETGVAACKSIIEAVKGFNNESDIYISCCSERIIESHKSNGITRFKQQDLTKYYTGHIKKEVLNAKN